MYISISIWSGTDLVISRHILVTVLFISGSHFFIFNFSRFIFKTPHFINLTLLTLLFKYSFRVVVYTHPSSYSLDFNQVNSKRSDSLSFFFLLLFTCSEVTEHVIIVHTVLYVLPSGSSPHFLSTIIS